MKKQVLDNIENELTFETSRSSGKGGQHVNKTESRVTLVWKYMESEQLTEEQKAKMLVGANQYISKTEIRISSEKTRSQFKNKEDAVKKLHTFLIDFFTVAKKRKPTKTPKSVIEKRLKDKTEKGTIKSTRQKISVRRLKED